MTEHYEPIHQSPDELSRMWQIHLLWKKQKEHSPKTNIENKETGTYEMHDIIPDETETP